MTSRHDAGGRKHYSRIYAFCVNPTGLHDGCTIQFDMVSAQMYLLTRPPHAECINVNRDVGQDDAAECLGRVLVYTQNR